MYSPKVFPGVPQEEIVKQVRKEGFEPVQITNCQGLSIPGTSILRPNCLYSSKAPPPAHFSGQRRFC